MKKKSALGLIKRQVKIQEIHYFHYTKVTETTLHELQQFLSKYPRQKRPQQQGEKDFGFDSIRVKIPSVDPTDTIRFEVGKNHGGTVAFTKILPNKYYYWKGAEIIAADSTEEIIDQQ